MSGALEPKTMNSVLSGFNFNILDILPFNKFTLIGVA